MAKNERTLQMEQEYVKLHNSGLSPKEIATKFHLSVRTVYSSLSEIAEEANVTRESLLEVPHKEHKLRGKKAGARPVDIDELDKMFDQCEAAFEEAIRVMDSVISSIDDLGGKE